MLTNDDHEHGCAVHYFARATCTCRPSEADRQAAIKEAVSKARAERISEMLATEPLASLLPVMVDATWTLDFGVAHTRATCSDGSYVEFSGASDCRQLAAWNQLLSVAALLAEGRNQQGTVSFLQGECAKRQTEIELLRITLADLRKSLTTLFEEPS